MADLHSLENDIPIAVIGTGYWGQNLVRAFAGLGNLAGVFDTNVERATEIAARFGSSAPWNSLTELLHDQRVSGVALATPAFCHAEHVRQALDAGKHVFVEKPMALHLSEAIGNVNLAQKLGRILMAGHLLEFHPAFRVLAEVVHSGKLGVPRMVTSNRLSLGKVRTEENAWWSLAPHDISMVCRLAGGAPATVRAWTSSWCQKDFPEEVFARLSFPNGFVATIHVSWCHPFKEHRLAVTGTQALAVFDDTAPERKITLESVDLKRRNGVFEVERGQKHSPAYEAVEPLKAECAHFVQCCRDGAVPLTGGADALRVVATLEAGQRSLDQDGKEIEVEEI